MTDGRNRYAVTVGFFDGVHLGHRHLIECLKNAAAERGMHSRIVTFEEHPRQILQSEYKPKLLTTPDDKIRRLNNCGTDACTSLHFTPELAAMSAKDFMLDILCNQQNAGCLLMGHDHRFGHECYADIAEYRRIGDEIGLEVILADALLINGEPVSSSRIRKCLSCGNVSEAGLLLGYSFSLSGIVVHGLKNGRRMGFPTANISLDSDMLQIPADGVYSAWATVNGKRYKSMLNIGFRPTIDGGTGERTVEAHLLDFDNDIYGERLSVDFVDFIRRERKFDSLDALSRQLKSDRDLIDKMLVQ